MYRILRDFCPLQFFFNCVCRSGARLYYISRNKDYYQLFVSVTSLGSQFEIKI